MKDRAAISAVLTALKKRYPRGERPWDGGRNPFRALIATILSAQTTDAQVDRVTPALFKRFPTPEKMAAARIREIEALIRSVGLHQAKARNIIAASRIIADEWGGRIPAVRDELTRLPGVGRKTANVVLIVAFGMPAMPVDTHVFRVARRIGLARGATPERVEQELTAAIPGRRLGAAHFWLIHHGRTLCTARNPKCPECPVARWCDFYRRRSLRSNSARTSS